LPGKARQGRLSTGLPRLVLLGLLVVAFLLRTYGLDWDRGLFFHPDERQILMVVDRLTLPGDWRVLLTPSSPWNPRFFAYGSFPLYLLRIVSWLLALWRPSLASMGGYYLVARLLSAACDTLTVFATYWLAQKAFNRRVAVLTAAFLTFAVLHIQLSHFYAVDTLLTSLILLAVNKAVDVAQRGQPSDGAQLGVFFGMALATKVSVLPLAIVVLTAWLASAWPSDRSRWPWRSKLRESIADAKHGMLLSFGFALGIFVLLQPYAIIDAHRFVTGVGQEVAMSQGWYDFPYTRQYAETLAYLYPVRQIVLFALGVPLGLLGLVGLLWLTVRTCKSPSRARVVLLVWPLLYGLMQGASFAKFIRYALPLLPFLCLAAAALWIAAWDGLGRFHNRVQVGRAALAVLLTGVWISTVFYAAAFLNVYGQAHPWIQASSWLCDNLSPGAVVATEVWDDPLPAHGTLAHRASCRDEVVTLRLDMYAPDSEGKGEALLYAVEAADWIVLSSQRLYAPITRLASRYPLASRYYRQLFAGRLGFELVAAPAVYPQLAGVTFLNDPRSGLQVPSPPLLVASRPDGMVLDFGWADESFVVYDHPQPLIFSREVRIPRQDLAVLLAP